MRHLEELFGLRGRTALVVGGSSGLGREAARALAMAGADVALVARRRERLEEVATELRALEVQAAPVPADVTNTEQVAAAIDATESALGPIAILLYAAGIAPLRRAELHSREQWDAAIATNVTAAFDVTQQVGRRMIDRGEGGRVIMLSSVVGSLASAVHRSVSYAASKGALTNLVRQLAVEWAKHGITVNAIAPSYFPTEMTIDPRIGEVPADMRERMEQFTPMGRLGREGELESAVIFLAAPASSYVTGAVLAVDGGWSAW